jgi:hypothetical protein
MILAWLDAVALTQLIVNSLAVGGAFLLGRMGTAALLWSAHRTAPIKAVPQGLRKPTSNLGGTTVAALAALILFGHGAGWRIMGGGAEGIENGGSSPTPPSTAPATAPTREPQTPATTKQLIDQQPVEPRSRIRLLVLGGDDVQNERFYLLNSETTPKNLSELTAALHRKSEPSHQPVLLEIVRNHSNRLALEHPAMTRVAAWAKLHGYTVTFPPEEP